MTKLLGALMVIACTGCLGVLKARRYAARPKELGNLQAALQVLETEIIYGATPLPEAMEQVAERCEGAVSSFFRTVSRELSSVPGRAVQEAWEKALEAHAFRLFLEHSDIVIIRRLGGCLGMSDRDDQAKHLQLTREQVKLEAQNAAEKAKTHVKLWNYMGFLSGLLLVTLCY